MRNQIVECVPNFSEGKDKGIMDQITRAITAVNDIELLSAEMGADVNRTVVTFIGPPEAVAEAAYQAIKTAAELIDMSQHKGAHPRMGATDVCPFVPVNDISMEECVALSQKVAERVGKELKIPVYLYEESAASEERRSLARVRSGEYEALPDKLKDKKWKPDYGPAVFNARAGATAIGAREFLIAFNITLNTKVVQYAMDIAFELREKGRSVRTGNIEPIYMRGDLVKYRKGHYPSGVDDFVGKTFAETRKHCKKHHQFDPYDLLVLNGSDAENPEGWSVKKPGQFTHCRAIGWYVEEFGRAQVTINFTNYKITPPHIVVEAARKLATERGLIVTGCEIVGLVPFQWIYDAGKYYLQQQERPTGVPVEDVIECAIHSLGLNDVLPFDPQEKILGLPRVAETALVSKTTRALVDEVSRETPAPGGGSIAALSGALGGALASMVSNLTIGKKGYEDQQSDLLKLAENAQSIKDQLLTAVDADTDAFNDYMAATRLPKSNKSETAARNAAIQAGLKSAVKVPLNTAQLSFEALECCAEVVEKGNINSVTDGGVGAQMAYSGIVGGTLNVLINLPEIEDEQFKFEMKATCAKLRNDGRDLLDKTLDTVQAKIDKLGK